MKTYSVHLSHDVARSFRCTKAANSMDINQEEKSRHDLSVTADIEAPYNIGLIVGASGSGKSTLAREIYGRCDDGIEIDDSATVLDQVPDALEYAQCAELLCGVGLTSVPCWIRPMNTLSNGQRARARVALALARGSDGEIVIDEWTSVVDRTAAKIMSACVAKYARKRNAKIVLLSCHRDVIQWLNPDWIIDCDTAEYTDRRLLCRSYQRKEKLQFEVRECDKRAWSMFSRYHYLKNNLPCGRVFYYGLYDGARQIGFMCFNNIVPHRDKTKPMIMHYNRLVVLPDFCGAGIGVAFGDACAQIVCDKGYAIAATISNASVIAHMKKNNKWVFTGTRLIISENKLSGFRKNKVGGSRIKVKTYSFRFAPQHTSNARQQRA